MIGNKFIPIGLAAAVTPGLAGLGTLAVAGERDREHGGAAEIQTMAAMRTTLPQAIAAAAQATGGRAIEAGAEFENGRLSLIVEVQKGN